MRILLPVDGSETSMRAVRRVVAMKDAFNDKLEVLLLNVEPAAPTSELLLDGRPSEIGRLERPARERGAQVEAPARSALAAGGIEHQVHVETGEVAAVIAAFARRYHCEMIVMGTRGASAISALWFGSNAQKVVQLAPVPVMLVP